MRRKYRLENEVEKKQVIVKTNLLCNNLFNHQPGYWAAFSWNEEDRYKKPGWEKNLVMTSRMIALMRLCLIDVPKLKMFYKGTTSKNCTPIKLLDRNLRNENLLPSVEYYEELNEPSNEPGARF